MNFIRYLSKPNGIALQLMKYAVVGGAAFLADFGSLCILTEVAGIHYLIATTFAFILGLTVNYLLSINWVFKSAPNDKSTFKTFILFAIVGVIGLGINALIMWFSTDICTIHYTISKLISTVIVFLWNFFGRRWLLTTKINA